MDRAQTGKRGRLVQSAVKLVHEQGFHRTTLADIAREADVPLGNVYYYFKTKDELGRALIEEQATRQEGLRRAWESPGDPRAELDAFITMTLDNRASLARSGCPIGTLCGELGKDGGPLAENAGGLFTGILTWLTDRFRALGKGDESRDLAVHLLSALQGASLLTHTFGDPDFVQGEAERLRQWLTTL
ncbi:TetR/AcrR family transcriptional regulator [Streptomyces sp. MUM 178J]|uniref:TetR/AcrR family transcriptional regulator n=1 Tax=Streptomyces sp. MUM 178J TaxID=2791991 RepID=UPI001F03E6BC|nr:TetR/AcrR family transcriptional regulator [Streptomyces sp. MUM 178J]WRQ80396.1 TetR/AcrR family transcriptional regulator [Streptomyces sp. MUM 178J]